METHKTVWFFERSAQHRQLEIRTALGGPGFEIIVRYPDGSEAVEWCYGAAGLIHRQEEVALTWQAEGWHPYVPEDASNWI